MDVEFVFEGPGECERCRAMVGTTSPTPIARVHPNCNCYVSTRCNNRCRIDGDSTTTRNAAGQFCIVFNADVTVTCWDGAESGFSQPVDIGCGVPVEAQFDRIEALLAGQVQALLDGCPPCAPPVVA